MDAHKTDSTPPTGDRTETRPPEDIFSSLSPEAPISDGQPRKRLLFARIWQVFRLIFVGMPNASSAPLPAWRRA